MYIHAHIDLKNNMGFINFIQLITFVIWPKGGFQFVIYITEGHNCIKEGFNIWIIWLFENVSHNRGCHIIKCHIIEVHLYGQFDKTLAIMIEPLFFGPFCLDVWIDTY
jgi:hypothetical protein